MPESGPGNSECEKQIRVRRVCFFAVKDRLYDQHSTMAPLRGSALVQQAANQLRCHSEPVLRLVWESPSSSRPLSSFDGDCHTSDIGHWFAMTRIKRPRSSKDGDCHTSDVGHWFAMTGNSIPRQCAKRSFTAKTIPSGSGKKQLHISCARLVRRHCGQTIIYMRNLGYN